MTGLFLDLAIYGMRQHGKTNVHRQIEAKLRELGGIKTVISHNYYSEDEFWSIYNKRNYDAVEAITDPKNLFRTLSRATARSPPIWRPSSSIRSPCRGAGGGRLRSERGFFFSG